MGGILERHGPHGTYFEVRAANKDGNLGGAMPMIGDQTKASFPKKIHIRADSWWQVRNPPGDPKVAVYADGTGPGATPPPAFRTVAPQFPAWSLIACWFSESEGAKSKWFYVGKDLTIYIPLNILTELTATGPGSYTPLIYLQYLCNDEVDLSRSDNHGWLHVYQDWIWK